MKKILCIFLIPVFFSITGAEAQSRYRRPAPKEAILAQREIHHIEVATLSTSYPVVMVSKPWFAWHWKLKVRSKNHRK